MTGPRGPKKIIRPRNNHRRKSAGGRWGAPPKVNNLAGVGKINKNWPVASRDPQDRVGKQRLQGVNRRTVHGGAGPPGFAQAQGEGPDPWGTCPVF